MEFAYYPKVFERIKSGVLDGIVTVLLLFVASYFFSFVEGEYIQVRIAVFILIFLIYDPLLTSMFGGTIGHHIVGIRVKRLNDESKNILFIFAVFRYIVKICLGWLSLLTISGNQKRRAIHDILAGSVVVYN